VRGKDKLRGLGLVGRPIRKDVFNKLNIPTYKGYMDIKIIKFVSLLIRRT